MELCQCCKRIYTNTIINERPTCLHCKDKVYPSKISVVYPEGSLHQKLATYAFNNLHFHFEEHPEEATTIADEFGVSEQELYAALEELFTEN